MSASLGWAFFATSADADMIWPDWQYPHCTTSRSSHACCTFLPVGVSPIASMVVIFFPAAAATGVTHERIGCPSRCTVHAPHSAIPQPNFVPVKPTTSRSAHRMGMSVGTSTVWSLPLMLRVIMVVHPSQCRALVQGDVVGLVALDFILWLTLNSLFTSPHTSPWFPRHQIRASAPRRRP